MFCRTPKNKLNIWVKKQKRKIPIKTPAATEPVPYNTNKLKKK